MNELGRYGKEDLDDVERMRQVRREIEKECKTVDGFFQWLRRIQLQHDRRRRQSRKVKHT
jgi:hypothetical protein